MTLYYFDDVAEKLIAYDTETKAARELPKVSLGVVAAPAINDEQPQPHRVYKERKTVIPPKAPRATNKPAKGKGCSECGSPSRHKKDCSKSISSKGNAEFQKLDDAPQRRGMSRMTFGRVKISQDHDIPAATVASNLDEPLDEILKAYEADTYDDYLAL
jgi:hypothetical protein